jgi:chromosome segregation ATPase
VVQIDNIMPSAMTDRLAQQLERRSRLDNELLQQQRKLAQSAAEQQTTATKEAALVAERAKLQSLRDKLTEQRDAAMAALRTRETSDQDKRSALSDALTARIKEVNERVEKENSEWTGALAENQRLKEKISIVKESIASGQDKFAELLKTREKEFEEMIEKSALLEQANVDLQARIDAAKALIEERLPLHKIARQKAEELNTKFAGIQEKIMSANAHFAKAKTDQAKLAKRLKTLETERETTIKAYERARADRDKEFVQEQKLDVETKQLIAVTERLLSTIKMLHQQLEEPAEAVKPEEPPAATSA